MFESQFEVNSKVCQDFPFEKAKWFKGLKIESNHIFPCYNQFLHIQIDMWMVKVWEVVSVGNLHEKGYLNKNLLVKQSQKEYKGRIWSQWSNAITSSKVMYQNTIWSHVFNTIWNNIWITHIP